MKTWEVIRMYYSNGNYEAFARLKPENVELKSAYLIGSGLASLVRMFLD